MRCRKCSRSVRNIFDAAFKSATGEIANAQPQRDKAGITAADHGIIWPGKKIIEAPRFGMTVQCATTLAFSAPAPRQTTKLPPAIAVAV